MNGVAAILGEGYLPSAIEFLDHRCLNLIGDLLPFSLTQPRPSVLIVEVDGPRRQVDDDMRAIVEIARGQWRSKRRSWRARMRNGRKSGPYGVR